MKKIVTINFLLIVSFALVLFQACDDTNNPAKLDSTIIPSKNVSFSKYIYPVFNQRCNSVGCHDDESQAAGISLTTWSNVVRDYLVVAPGDPQNSRLVWAIEGNGAQLMPPIGSYGLTTNQIDGIKTWIKEGAKNN